MTTPQELKIAERDTTITPRQLRTAGFVPGTLYGKNVESQSVQIKTHEFCQMLAQGHRLFNLTGFYTGLAKAGEIQFDRVTQKPLSVQFVVVSAADAKSHEEASACSLNNANAEQTQPEMISV